METDTEKSGKKCWKCKRTLVGGSVLGLCPDCLNTNGSPVVAGLGAVGIVALGFLGKKLLANGGKVAKIASDVIKLFIS